METEGSFFCMLIKGGTGEAVLDAIEISCACAFRGEEPGPVQYMDFPAPLSVCLEIFFKDSSLSVTQEEAPFSEFPQGGIGYSVRIFGKESPFLKVKGVWRTSEGLVVIVSIDPCHKCGSA